ncbi:MAG TPA: type II secretion system F family protein [Lacunisphaera sp.]|nr:type II secretion system F family protein [Lacunisphaera sp.]
MPGFAYTAREPGGPTVHGTVDAPSRRDALRMVSARGLRPLSVEESTGSKQTLPIPAAASGTWGPALQLPLIRALSRLVDGGLSASEGVRLLAVRLKEPPLRTLAAALWQQLSQGRTLSQALADHPRVFAGQTVSLIAAGEATGSLREVLQRLILHLTQARETRRRLLAALSYPLLVCGLSLAVILFFLFFLLPRLQVLLDSLGGELPWATQLLVSLADFLLHYGLVVALVIVLTAVAWWRWRQSPGGRHATDAWLLRAPLAGTYTVRLTILNFTHTMAILLENGITTAESLRLAERTIENLAMREKLHQAIDRVLEGETLSGALARTQLLPLLVLDQLAVGEQTGRLAPSLRAIAEEYQADVSRWLESFTKVISSAVLAAAFGFVAFLAYAIVSAVLQVSSSFHF